MYGYSSEPIEGKCAGKIQMKQESDKLFETNRIHKYIPHISVRYYKINHYIKNKE